MSPSFLCLRSYVFIQDEVVILAIPDHIHLSCQMSVTVVYSLFVVAPIGCGGFVFGSCFVVWC